MTFNYNLTYEPHFWADTLPNFTNRPSSSVRNCLNLRARRGFWFWLGSDRPTVELPILILT